MNNALKLLDKNLDWSDAQFYGFSWINDGKDLELFLNHASKPISGLVCNWAHNLVIDLDWSNNFPSPQRETIKVGGPLLIQSIHFEYLNDFQYLVTIVFGAQGEIKFSCEFIEMVEKQKA